MTKARDLAQIVSSGVSEAFKNRIINGAMVINQRALGSVNPDNGAVTVDRWQAGVDITGKFTVNQSSIAPTGFTNSFIVTSSSAYTPSSNEAFNIRQNIEGFNTADLAWGTADAKTVTLSFWVRSSLTGTFGGSFVNSAYDRSYPFSYTISSANTWEYKTVTVAGDTSGTWVGATNGVGLRILFGLGAGSSKSGTAGAWASGFYNQPTGTVSVVGTNGATFYITGVQLEVGSTATSFDYRPYGTELALCQRYFFTVRSTGAANGENVGKTGIGTGSTDLYRSNMALPVTMRATPTISVSNNSGAGTDLRAFNGASVLGITALGGQFSNPNYIQADWTMAGSFAAGAYVAFLWRDNVSNAWLRASAEL